MSNLISVLSSFADVGVFVLSRSCLSAAQLLSDETMQHRYDLFHRPNVTRIDLSDLRTVRQARDAPPLNGRICGISPNSEKLQSLVLPLFFRNLSLDVLLFRTQRLRPMSNNSATVVRVLMPTVTSLLSTPEASIPNGRAWIVYMNSHIDSNANFTAQLSRWVVQRQHRVLFQETGQVQFAVNALGSFNSSVLWAPPIGAVRNLDNTRPKVHPRGARPLTLCYFGSVTGNLYLSNDLVLGFAIARQRLAPGQLHMILIESTAAFRSMPLTPDLLHDVEYRTGAIPHAEALELYRTRCDLGVRGIEQKSSGSLGTKIFEMAAFGIPTIVNPVPVNTDVYGPTYPYYWSYGNETESMAALLVRAATDPDEFDYAARSAVQAAIPYTFDALRSRIEPWIEQARRAIVRVAIVVGVRPNVVKAAAIVAAMRRRGDVFAIDLIHSGQHVASEMSDVLFEELQLEPPQWRVDARPPTHGSLSRNEHIDFFTNALESRLRVTRPQFVMALGDVTTAVATARAGRNIGAVVVHYEGGLRCDDPNMPEEINRREADALSDVVLTTEESANANLRDEPAMRDKLVVFVGNVMIDSIVTHRQRAALACNASVLAGFNAQRHQFVLVTVHRQANVNNPTRLAQVVDVLEACVSAGFKLLFAAHPRTRDRLASDGGALSARVDALSRNGLVTVGALPYLTFLGLMDAASAVLTDSGGVQEETSFLGVPCVTMRNATERPSTLMLGTNVLASIEQPQVVVRALREQMRRWPRSSGGVAPRIPLWDGRASERIADWFLEVST
jgi:UDP-N-acetylglucosamine 2-epimerase (non-hydrolysing)